MTGRVLSLLVASLLASSVSAQYIGTTDEEYTYGGAASRTLSVGPAAVDVSFLPVMGLRQGADLSDATGIGARISGKNQTLTAAYVSTDPGGEAGLVDFTFGPSITPFATRDSLQLALRIPIRFGFGYTYLQPGPSSEQEGGPAEDPYHIGRAGLGVGLQLQGGFVTGSDVAEEIVGSVYALAIPGIQAEFSAEPFEQVHAQRSSEFGVEVQANHVGGSRVGLSVGYTLLRTGWRPESVSAFGDVLDAITPGGLDTRRRLGLFHVGLSF